MNSPHWAPRMPAGPVPCPCPCPGGPLDAPASPAVPAARGWAQDECAWLAHLGADVLADHPGPEALRELVEELAPQTALTPLGKVVLRAVRTLECEQSGAMVDVDRRVAADPRPARQAEGRPPSRRKRTRSVDCCFSKLVPTFTRLGTPLPAGYRTAGSRSRGRPGRRSRWHLPRTIRRPPRTGGRARHGAADEIPWCPQSRPGGW